MILALPNKSFVRRDGGSLFQNIHSLEKWYSISKATSAETLNLSIDELLAPFMVILSLRIDSSGHRRTESEEVIKGWSSVAGEDRLNILSNTRPITLDEYLRL